MTHIRTSVAVMWRCIPVTKKVRLEQMVTGDKYMRTQTMCFEINTQRNFIKYDVRAFTEFLLVHCGIFFLIHVVVCFLKYERIDNMMFNWICFV
jgi:hypothetical protein